MAYLEVRGVAKSFGKKKLLDGLSLEVEQGECVVVFGPSGCGKTVLLRIIAGVLEPDRGEVWIDGKSVTDVGPEARGVAMAFQNFALYPHMDAFENIASPLRARSRPEAEIKQRVHEIAGLLRIDHVLDHLPKQLSNGQKQRTSLARSLVHGPSVLHARRPAAQRGRQDPLRDAPRAAAGASGSSSSTVLYVTQDYKEALALGDRIGVLMDGHFEQVDTPAAIYGNPRNRRGGLPLRRSAHQPVPHPTGARQRRRGPRPDRRPAGGAGAARGRAGRTRLRPGGAPRGRGLRLRAGRGTASRWSWRR